MKRLGLINHVCVYKLKPRYTAEASRGLQASADRFDADKYYLCFRTPEAEMFDEEKEIFNYLMKLSKGVVWYRSNKSPLGVGDIIAIGIKAFIIRPTTLSTADAVHHRDCPLVTMDPLGG